MANPTLLDMPIARDGNKNAIPTTDNGTTGLLSQQYGWQLINAIPPQQGGKAVKREDFNGVFNLLSNILFYAQKGWQWEFDETQDYFAGCTVKDTADGKTYVCIADVNASTTHPSSDTTHWKLSDLATKGDLANYLPLAGGTMTGAHIYRSVNNSDIDIIGGTQAGKGGRIQLYGAENSDQTYKGCFGLCATDSTNTAWLEGFPNGTLKWAGANVLTDANGGYLPLSGGIMTGIIGSANNGALLLAGGNGSDIASFVQLEGKNSSSATGPRAILSATSDTDDKQYTLMIRPRNGELVFGEYRVHLNDLGGSAIVAKSLGATGYIKYASGLVMQWGTVTNLPASQSVVPVTFPITFPNGVGPVIITSAGNYGNQRGFSWGQVKDITTSGFNLSEASSDVDSQGKNWFAIGY